MLAAMAPHPPRWLHIVTKTAIALFSVAFLGLAALVANDAHNGAGWRNACIFAMVGVVVVVAQARTRWSFAVLFASVAFGFTSCANTFHWAGG
jgi:apolipoprotein N-acyltransferase